MPAIIVSLGDLIVGDVSALEVLRVGLINMPLERSPISATPLSSWSVRIIDGFYYFSVDYSIQSC